MSYEVHYKIGEGKTLKYIGITDDTFLLFTVTVVKLGILHPIPRVLTFEFGTRVYLILRQAKGIPGRL